MSEENEFLSYAARRAGASESNSPEMGTVTEEANPATPQSASEMGASTAATETQEGNEAAQQAQNADTEGTTPAVDASTDADGSQPQAQEQSLEEYLSQQPAAQTEDSGTEAQSNEEVESLKARIKELESNQVTFASDWMKTLNDMSLKGATKEQIDSFIRINQLGNLEEMDAVDAKVSKLVLIDGFSEKAARALVKRNFDIEGRVEEFGEDSEEVELLKEELKISAKNDLKELGEYRKQLSIVENPAAKEAEQQELALQAQQAQFVKFVEKEAPKISTFFPKSDSHKIRVGGEKGMDLELDFKYEQEFIEKQLPSYVKNALTDAGETTQASIKEAFEYAQAVYWANPENRAKFAKAAAEKAYNAALEAKDKEYANISGLPRHDTPIQRTIPKEQKASFLQRVVGGQ